MKTLQKFKSKLLPKIANPATLWSLILLVVLLALLALIGILPAGEGDTSPWNTPVVPQSTPTATPLPGWWQAIPTPQPVFPTGDAP